jgi:predicted permease
VLILGLGIGANVAIFSIADAVLLRPLPVGKPHDLIVLRQRGPAGDIFPFNSAAAVGLRHEVLAGLAVFRPAPNTLISVNGQTDLALAQSVSGNYHAVLGVRAVLGRTLTEQDREPVVVISHRYWQQRFAGDSHVVGRTVEMQGRSFTVVGVTPPEFFGTQPGRHVDVTAPLGAQTVTMPPNARWLYLVGRLGPGVSRDQAQAALRVRWAQLAAAGSLPPRPAVTLELELDSGAQGLNELRREFSLPLQILMAAVGVVLLVASANLAGLLIVRSTARQQEIAVRLSLGASHGRIVRQLLTESALLAGAGGAAGLVFANRATNVLLAMMSRGRGPLVLDVAPNARTFAFAAAVTIVTAALFGLLPALGASRTDPQQRLKLSARGAENTRNTWARAMVAAQIALLVLLLSSAGLFTRTLQKLRSVDAGFRQDQVLVVNVSIGQAYPGDRKRGLYEELYTRFGALPGVQSVSMSMDTPPAGELSMCGGIEVPRGIEVPSRPVNPEAAPPVCRNFVGPRFFETMGIPVLAGRDFESADDARAPNSVVISESVARGYFGVENPLGHQIVVEGAVPRTRVSASIVGVVKDVRYSSLRADPPMMIYRPYRQEAGAPSNSFLLRTSSMTAEALTPLLRAEVRAAAPVLPPPSVVSLEDRIAGVLVEERMLATLSNAISALAAILAAVGIYSIVAATVARRQGEIGIRIAVGALPGQVARMVVSETLRIVAAGLAVGIPVAVATAMAARALLAGVLFELSPTDPTILFSSVIAIMLIAALAASIPAQRAARVDPLVALRYE